MDQTGENVVHPASVKYLRQGGLLARMQHNRVRPQPR